MGSLFFGFLGLWWLGLPVLVSGGASYSLTLAHLAWPAGLFFVACVTCRSVPSVSKHLWIIGAALAALGCMLWSVVRIWSLRAGAYDLGIFDQVMHQFVQGEGFYSSLRHERSFLGDHFVPLVGLLAPFFVLLPSPYALPLIQVALLYAAAVPLFFLSRRKLGDDAAWVAVFLYGISVPVRSVCTYDFHPVAMAPVLLLFAWERLDRGKLLAASSGLILCLLVKESTALAVLGLGVVAWVHYRRRGFGLAWIGSGLCIFLLLNLVVIPEFRNGEAVQYVTRYKHLGGSFSEIVWNLITRPWLWLHAFGDGAKWEYLARWLVPLAGLPLLAPRVLVGAAPLLALNMLTDYRPMHSIHFQYTAELLPFFAVAAVEGTARITKHRRWVTGAACVFLSLSLAEPSEFSKSWWYWPDERTHRIRTALDQIPPATPVSAQFNLVPQLTRRKHVYLLPKTEGAGGPAKWIAVDRRARLRTWNMRPDRYREVLSSLSELGYQRRVAFEEFELWQLQEP